MKGYVETPPKIVDLMVDKLFKFNPPSTQSKVLDTGCGTGPFIEGIIRWCHVHNVLIPKIVGVELNSRLVLEARNKFASYPTIFIEQKDFLIPDDSSADSEDCDFVIGNPPYVPITKLSKKEKKRYRAIYETARGRFDLYLLFFERAFQRLRPEGRLVFVTPEKFLYVETASQLRKLMSGKQIEEIQMLDENSFGKLVTYPAITTVVNEPGPSETLLILRNGQTTNVVLSANGSSWLPYNSLSVMQSEYTLEDICERISCGVATGADAVFVKERGEFDTALARFAYPTVSGRELTFTDWKKHPRYSMLVPYERGGRLLNSEELGAFMNYLSDPENRRRLEKRTCVARKPWYAFHENPPLPAILKPKILCKDITNRPYFWIDREGKIIPRHSVYYIVPKDPSRIDEIAEYLNSEEVRRWLESHCQRAANAFLRIQSHILKKVPTPRRLAERSVISVTTESQQVHSRRD
jgi:tRNA1(Val) A37 N6-methylase TrmN6